MHWNIVVYFFSYRHWRRRVIFWHMSV